MYDSISKGFFVHQVLGLIFGAPFLTINKSYMLISRYSSITDSFWLFGFIEIRIISITNISFTSLDEVLLNIKSDKLFFEQQKKYYRSDRGVGVRMTQRQNDTVRHFGTVRHFSIESHFGTATKWHSVLFTIFFFLW